jgi:hypothetical protein
MHLRMPERRCPWIYAVLLAEDQFRPRPLRLLEYLAWSVLWPVSPRRASRISVGIAQVQVRHWATFGFMDTPVPTPKNIFAAMSLEANYDVAQAYLRDRLRNEHWNARRIAACYVGEARSYHVRTLEEAYRVARDVLSLANISQ